MLDRNNDYCPTDVQDIVFGDGKAKGLITDIVSGAMQFPFAGVNGIILLGPNGTGKSALAHLLPAAINGVGQPHITPVDYIFERITTATDGKELMEKMAYGTQFVPLQRFKYYVLDEFDLLSPRHMASMKSIMNCKTSVFIMTTNNISKIDSGIKSRSHLVNMPLANAALWVPVMQAILLDQKVIVPDETGLHSIVERCNYDARKIVGATVKLAQALFQQGKVIPPAANANTPDQTAA